MTSHVIFVVKPGIEPGRTDFQSAALPAELFDPNMELKEGFEPSSSYLQDSCSTN